MLLMKLKGIILDMVKAIYPWESSYFDNEKGVVAVSATTGATGGCSGTIAVIGNYTNNTLKFINYTKEEGAESCVVSVNFKDGKKGKKLGIISEEGCSYFHGAACAFDGELVQKRKP